MQTDTLIVKVSVCYAGVGPAQSASLSRYIGARRGGVVLSRIHGSDTPEPSLPRCWYRRNFVMPTGEARPARALYAALRDLVRVDSTAPRQTVFDAASAIIVEAVRADALDIFLYDAPSASLIAVSTRHS